MRTPLAVAAAGLLAISLPAGVGVAQTAIKSQRVTFPAGASATQLKGQLKGDQTVDYKLRAGAGQTLTVELKGSNPQNYFNVMAAGTDNALFIGSSSGNRFSGLLPSDGDVRVRVYLMRPAARRNETSTYSLKLGIGGAPLAPVPASRDALIPGTPYHASADVPCGSGSSGKGASCKASVIRRANNSGTVVVTNPEGQKRQFLFVKGKAVASDQPEKLSVQRRGDVSVLTLGENFERYEIVDALVVGGLRPLPSSLDLAMNRTVLGLSVLLLSITGAPVFAIPPPPPDDVRVVKVLDGNTIVVTPYGDPFTVRLACIHAPSLRQGRAGQVAKVALERLLPPGAWVTLSTRSKAADGVDLAEIIPVGSTLTINLSLVQVGMAALNRQTSSPCNQVSYREAELRARTMRLGLWGPSPGSR